MNSKRALRIAIIAEILLGISGIVLSVMLEDSLPLPLQEWLIAEEDADLGPAIIILSLSAVALLPVMLIACGGLFFFQSWARWLYLGGLFAIYGLALFTGPTVEHAVADVVDEMTTLVDGVILGIVFFTNACEKAKPPIQGQRS